MKNLVVVCSLFFLAACVSKMDEAACAEANWYRIGYSDGEKGYFWSAFDKVRDECADFGIAADRGLYLEGHSEGVLVFCQPINGFRRAVEGEKYRDVCPKELSARYMEADKAGRKVRKRKKDVDRIAKKLEKKKIQLTYVQSELDLERGRLDSQKKTMKNSRRKRIKKKIDRLKLERQVVKDRIKELSERYDKKRYDWEYFRRQMASQFE